MHVLYCRRHLKSGLQARVFVQIASFLIVVYAISAFFLQGWCSLDAHSLWGLPLQISAGLIFVLLVPVYLTFYVLTQLQSPSKKILLTVAQHEYLSYEDIVRCVQEEDFINTRLNDLLTSGCVQRIENRYRLTKSGKKIALMLNIMQAVLCRWIC